MIHTERTFAELLAGFEDAMLVTRSPEGALRGRPMRIAERRGDGSLIFVSRFDTPKVDEVLADPRAAVTLQGGGRYLTVSGQVRVVPDPGELLDRLWDAKLDEFFPQGPRTPDLTVLLFESEEGEYWDDSLANRLRLTVAGGLARFGVTEEPAGEEQKHAKVDLR